MFFSKFDIKASDLKDRVWLDECGHPQYYEDEQVRLSIVHTRCDVVMIISYLSSANKQLCGIKWTLIFLLIILMIRIF